MLKRKPSCVWKKQFIRDNYARTLAGTRTSYRIRRDRRPLAVRFIEFVDHAAKNMTNE